MLNALCISEGDKGLALSTGWDQGSQPRRFCTVHDLQIPEHRSKTFTSHQRTPHQRLTIMTETPRITCRGTPSIFRPYLDHHIRVRRPRPRRAPRVGRHRSRHLRYQRFLISSPPHQWPVSAGASGPSSQTTSDPLPSYCYRGQHPLGAM